MRADVGVPLESFSMQCVTRYLARAADLERRALETGSEDDRRAFLHTACGWRNLALQARLMAAAEDCLAHSASNGDDETFPPFRAAGLH